MRIEIKLDRDGWMARFVDVPDMPGGWMATPYLPPCPVGKVLSALRRRNPGITVAVA